MELYLIMVDARFAHEADCLYSVWSDKKDAEKEAKRLNESDIYLGLYGGSATVKKIDLNKSYNEFQ